MLRTATGRCAADLDQPLWVRVLGHKTNRHGVAHAAGEPTEGEAGPAVEDMLRMAQLIDGIS